jgi:hypothetical protein
MRATVNLQGMRHLHARNRGWHHERVNTARPPRLTLICTAVLSMTVACHAPTEPSVSRDAPARTTSRTPAPSGEVVAEEASKPVADAVVAQPSAVAPPTTVDLRHDFEAQGLVPRRQGARGTCSVFTTCSAIEWALAKHRGRAERLSVEFLNWSAGQFAGAPSDGNFFHNALGGFERFGVCAEDALPYRASYDAALAPAPAALADAAHLRDECRSALTVHWIVPWQANRFGVTDVELREIKSVIARGFPVAAGSGHSRLLVGYRDDAAQPGGGIFITEDSALGRFDEVTFAFVEKDVADVFWIEAR